MKKILTIILASLAISPVYTYQENCCNSKPVECECPKPQPCCDIPTPPEIAAFNKSAAIDVCGSWDTYVSGTFLWIEPNQGSMEFAGTSFLDVNQQATQPAKIHNQNFKWKPAFKVGIGLNFGYDNWDSFLRYTRINTKMGDQTTLGNSPNESLSNLYGQQSFNLGETIRKVTVDWKLNFNTFDLEFASV